jgi:hypothetical protein
MHPIQDLFLESFSYVIQFDMHFYMHSYVDKNLILVKKVGVTGRMVKCWIPKIYLTNPNTKQSTSSHPM